MDLLKLALTTLFILILLNYLRKAGEIILIVNASLEGQKKVLMHLVKKKKYPSQYKSKIQSSTEKKYNKIK